MSDFSTQTELSITVSDRETRSVRRQLEQDLADVPVGLDPRGSADSGASRQPRDPETGQFMEIEGVEQRLVEQHVFFEELLEQNERRNELLEAGDGDGQGRRRQRRRREHRWARDRTDNIEEILEILQDSDDDDGGIVGGTAGGGGSMAVGAGLGGLAGGGLGGGLATRLMGGGSMRTLARGGGIAGGLLLGEQLVVDPIIEQIEEALDLEDDEIPIQVIVEDIFFDEEAIEDLEEEGIEFGNVRIDPDDDTLSDSMQERIDEAREQARQDDLLDMHLEYQHNLREDEAERDLINMHEEFQETLRNDPFSVYFEPNETVEELSEAFRQERRTQQEHHEGGGSTQAEANVGVDVSVGVQEFQNRIEDMVADIEAAIQDAENVVETDVRDLETRVSEIERAQRFATQ